MIIYIGFHLHVLIIYRNLRLSCHLVLNLGKPAFSISLAFPGSGYR